MVLSTRHKATRPPPPPHPAPQHPSSKYLPKRPTKNRTTAAACVAVIFFISFRIRHFLSSFFANDSGYFRDHFFPRPDDDHENRTALGVVGTRPAVVYGLLHMAKTGGTTINGELALRHERVCGNKGNSHDYSPVNEHLRTKLSKPQKTVDLAGNATHRRLAYDNRDTRFQNRKRKNINLMNHGHVAPVTMYEMGFHDCDYVANEIGAKFWKHTFRGWHRPLELHVPCRDPVDLLLSMCNYQQVPFTCRDDFASEVEACFGNENRRFDAGELRHPFITLKCFRSPSGLNGYLAYMGERLQRRETTETYVHRDSNAARNTTDECLWRQDYTYNLRLVEYLRKNTVYMRQYFKFCSKCLKSDNNLLQRKKIII
mmetsp:Transcript_23094/g.46107  ORF Transcript_23094/g.46107 Transcript_23094/m.46107 type:complete len:371 (+) Transcript_23094:222-1334(+)